MPPNIGAALRYPISKLVAWFNDDMIITCDIYYIIRLLLIVKQTARALGCSGSELINEDASDGRGGGEFRAIAQNSGERAALRGGLSIDDRIMDAVRLLDAKHKNKVFEYIRDRLMVSDYMKIKCI